jgi:hypothetical protein
VIFRWRSRGACPVWMVRSWTFRTSLSSSSSPASPADDRFDSGDEDTRRKRFGYIIVCAPSSNPVTISASSPFGGEHDNRAYPGYLNFLSAVAPPQGRRSPEASDPGRSDEVGSDADAFRASSPDVGTGHFISFAIQIIADQFQDVLFIVDDQYFLFTHIIISRYLVSRVSDIHYCCA